MDGRMQMSMFMKHLSLDIKNELNMTVINLFEC